jgi:hypothetical protein
MTNITIDAGTLTASVEERTVTGLLVPYGEECRSNLGKFSVGPGVFSIPTDVPNTVGFNTEHEREASIGRGVTAKETDAGIVATFSIAATPEGDAALADIAAGKRKHLSAEVANVLIKDGRAVGGRLFGGALVATPAFPSATLLAAAADVLPEDEELTDEEKAAAASTEPAETEDKVVSTFKDEQGVEHKKTTTTKTKVEDGKTTITTTEVIEEPDAPVETEEAPVANAIPNTLTAGAVKAEPTLRQTMTMLASAVSGQAPSAALTSAVNGGTLQAALADVKFDAPGSPGIAMRQPAWLGELWDGKVFERKIVPLFGSAPLTAIEVQGYRWLVKPEMNTWLGNKSNVPSNSPTTESFKEVAQRYAGGHDIAREYVDFPSPDFWESYYRAMTESYARLSDSAVLTKALSSATTVTRGNVPAGVGSGWTSIVDGALAVLDEDVPTFAVVAKDVYRDLFLTRKDDVLEFLSASLGLEEGTLNSFKVVAHKDIPAGKVLVGNSAALTVHEFAGAPIRTEALDQIKGGIDAALFGYLAAVVHNSKALALVSATA